MQLFYTSLYFFIILILIQLHDFNSFKYNFSLKAQKTTTPQDNSANQQNPNKGTSGTNKAYDQAQGNKGTQQNPNQKGGGGGGKSGGGKK